jgi:hypothetical protein
VIGQTCRGIDEARAVVDGLARYIADQMLRHGEVSPYALDAYRDATTNLRDMNAMNSERCAMRQAVAR